jgi:hypothetical protein
VSAGFLLEGFQRGSVQFPGTLTGNSFTLDVSLDGEAWTALQDSAGNPLAGNPCSADECCPIPSAAFQYRWGRINMASNEQAARSVAIHLRA